jgi:hypothetical protein
MVKFEIKTCKMVLWTAFLLLAGCRKSDHSSANTRLALRPNVHIIDSTKISLLSDSTSLSQGIYEYAADTALSSINTGDIIVGATNGGYIREIVSISNGSNEITFQTSQGTMEDVFLQGTFGFSFDTDSLVSTNSPFGYEEAHPKEITCSGCSRKTTQGTGYNFNLGQTSIYQNGPLSISLKNASIQLSPTWQFSFGFGLSGISAFDMECKNAMLDANFDLNVSCSQAVNLVNQTFELGNSSRTITYTVPIDGIPVPVVVVMNLKLICSFSLNAGATINRDILLATNNSFNLGVNYSSGNWQPTYNLTPNSTITTLSQTSGQANLTLNFAITPQISFFLYNVAGPYASVSPEINARGDVGSPSLNWDFQANTWLEAALGVEIQSLGKTIKTFGPATWDTDTLSYITPFQINKISGDLQSGTGDNQLSQPLVIQVVDSKGSPQSNVPVYFSVTGGAGSISPSSVLSDNNGNAQALWTLGLEASSQSASASVEKADSTNIASSPLVFTATNTAGNAACSFGNSFTVTHTAGAVAPVSETVTYNTVQSNLTGASQCWIVQNLGAQQPASSATDASEGARGWFWQFNLPQGYQNFGTRVPNTTWEAPLYGTSDWLPSNDPCALLLGNGWRLPTQSEWSAANSTGGWNGYIDTYNSVLKLHAAGSLWYLTGALENVGISGYEWSSTQVSSDNSGGWVFAFDQVNRSFLSDNNQSSGFNVRCLQ